MVNEGRPHFSEIGLEAALTNVIESGRLTACHSTEGIPPAQYYIITVGTPLRPGTYEPRLDMIEEASRQVADHLPDGAAVILRSTVRIGTTRDVVKPVLDKSGRNYRLAMCPERTLEGDALRELAGLPQIIGGLTPEGGGALWGSSRFARVPRRPHRRGRGRRRSARPPPDEHRRSCRGPRNRGDDQVGRQHVARCSLRLRERGRACLRCGGYQRPGRDPIRQAGLRPNRRCAPRVGRRPVP